MYPAETDPSTVFSGPLYFTPTLYSSHRLQFASLYSPRTEDVNQVCSSLSAPFDLSFLTVPSWRVCVCVCLCVSPGVSAVCPFEDRENTSLSLPKNR